MESSQTYELGRKVYYMQLAPLMLCFFTMGLVDLTGIASNYVQRDLNLTDAQAGLLPSIAFLWMMIICVLSGMSVSKIGMKRSVMIGLSITVLSLIIPVRGHEYAAMLVAFSLLGIGNALIMRYLFPLVRNLAGVDRRSSALTFGEFISAMASLSGPILAAWGASTYLPTFGLGWRTSFAVYAVIVAWTLTFLGATPLEEGKANVDTQSVGKTLRSLARPAFLLYGIAIMCSVGIDIGTNTFAPKIVIERIGIPLEEAGYALCIYFVFRTVGALLCSSFPRSLSSKLFFLINVVMVLAAMAILSYCYSLTCIYIALAFVGFGNSNLYSVVFSQAVRHSHDVKKAGWLLMTSGLFGGVFFPMAMGYAADAAGQIGGIAVMVIGVVYLMLSFYLFNNTGQQ